MAGLEQKLYEAPILVPNEHHMALVFVLDTSDSMYGAPINELNKGLNLFKEQVCKDSHTRKVLDVAIVEFNTDFSVPQDFTPVEYMDTIELTTKGLTYYTDPIREAIQMVSERSKFYKNTGTEPYKPWIIFVTDGAPMDDITDVAREIKELQDADKLRFISLGVEGYDSKVLHTLSDAVFRLEGKDFTSFFNWVSKSMRAVSVSVPGDKVALSPLDGNVYRDRDVSDI